MQTVFFLLFFFVLRCIHMHPFRAACIYSVNLLTPGNPRHEVALDQFHMRTLPWHQMGRACLGRVCAEKAFFKKGARVRLRASSAVTAKWPCDRLVSPGSRASSVDSSGRSNRILRCHPSPHIHQANLRGPRPRPRPLFSSFFWVKGRIQTVWLSFALVFSG